MLIATVGLTDDESRRSCTHASYTSTADPRALVCRCVICARCQAHTGNSHQGHFWSSCKVTGGTRLPHFCCPGWCELEHGDERPGT